MAKIFDDDSIRRISQSVKVTEAQRSYNPLPQYVTPNRRIYPGGMAGTAGTAGYNVLTLGTKLRDNTSVLCLLLTHGLTTTGTTTTVYDPGRVFSAGVGTNKLGLAIPTVDPVSQQTVLQFVGLEGPAAMFCGTLLQDINDVNGTAMASVGTYFALDWNRRNPGQEVVLQSLYPMGSNTGVTGWLCNPDTGPPTYLLMGDGGRRLFNIQLYNNAKKRTDNWVEVKLLDFNGDQVGLPVRCHDPHGEFSSGLLEDATGIAGMFHDDESEDKKFRLQFVQLQGPANLIVATLAAAMSGGGPVAGVPTFWRGPNWHNEDPRDTNNQVALVAAPGITYTLGSGATAVAELYNPDTDPLQYMIVEVQGGNGAAMTAKILATVPARSGGVYGAGQATLGIPVNGVWTPLTGTLGVLNPASVDLWVGTGYILAPVTQQGTAWVLNPTELPQVTNWRPLTEMHLVQCSGGLPRWEDYAPIVRLYTGTEDMTACTLFVETFCSTEEISLDCNGTGTGTFDCNSLGTDCLQQIAQALCDLYGTAREFVTDVDCQEGTGLVVTTEVITVLACPQEGT